QAGSGTGIYVTGDGDAVEVSTSAGSLITAQFVGIDVANNGSSSTDLDLSGRIESFGNGVTVSNFGASPLPFIAAADAAPEVSVDPASINVALAEDGSIAAEYHGI